MRIPLTFGNTEKYSKNVNAGRCINMFPVVNSSDSKNQLTLTNTPGLEPWLYPQYGEVRGLFVSGTRYLYAVVANKAYLIDVPTETSTEIGTLQTYTGKVWIVKNGYPQIMFCDGTYGYVYEGGTNTFVQITDTDFPGCGSLAMIDNYAIISEPSTGRMWNSELNDFTSWVGSDSEL